ncbi:hypothetical protein IU488_10235 [Nocardia farcinica]|nr:hypothetical protein [Nocardia farcinica]
MCVPLRTVWQPPSRTGKAARGQVSLPQSPKQQSSLRAPICVPRSDTARSRPSARSVPTNSRPPTSSSRMHWPRWTCTMLKRSQVEAWNFEAVREWIRRASSSRQDLMEHADSTRNYFRDVEWQGSAYSAAYDRVAQDHDQIRKLSGEVEELEQIAFQHISDVEAHLRVVQGRVADAQALGMVVDDAWKVMDYENVDPDTRKAHQDLINAAFWSFEDSVSRAAQRIAEQAVEIRSAGDLLGSSLDVADADSQAARFGSEDGKALADAVAKGDQAAVDRILAQMPQPILSQYEMDALANGTGIDTLPASTQDYYRSFFQQAGKEGVLGLNEQLLAKERAGDPLAAAQRTNLANSILAISNEKVSSPNGPNGSYQNLPADLRGMISGRSEDFIGAYTGPPELAENFRDLSAFGELLGQSHPGIEPGKELGVELGRQAADMADYLDDVDKNFNGNLPTGFDEGDRETIESGAASLLDIATRNDEVNYSLLTGNDMPEVPAVGEEYKPSRFDPNEFRNTIFHHEWSDDGAAASNLLEWVADDSGKPGEEGLRANQVLSQLPDYFAPTELTEDGQRIPKSDGDSSVFESNVQAFNANPKLADALAHVMGTNIPSYESPLHDESTVKPDPDAPSGQRAVLETTDADRLLFLASQSEAGRLLLETSRQEYEADLIARALADEGGDPARILETQGNNLAQLDGRITNAITNALTYQNEQKLAEHNNAQQETYENRQKAGEIVKSLTLDNMEIPGKGGPGMIGNAVFDVIKDQGYEAAMNKWNPEPTTETMPYPDPQNIDRDTRHAIRQQIVDSLFRQGQLPEYGFDRSGNRADFVDQEGLPVDVRKITATSEEALNHMLRERGLFDFVDRYTLQHTTEILAGLAQEEDDLERFLTGKATTK